MKWIAIIIIIFLLYVYTENRYILRIRRKNLNSSDDRIKILHLSDLHKPLSFTVKALLSDIVKRQKPDIIIFSGDLITRSCTDISKAEYLISELVKIAPVYFCIGNHEVDLSRDMFEKLTAMLTKHGVSFAGQFTADIHGRKLCISSATLQKSVYKKNGGYRNLDSFTLRELTEDVGSPSSGCENLLIVHNPFFAEIYSEWGADYAFCGHVHGGIVRLFGIGLLSPERRLFPKYSKGVYDIGKMRLLVSGGIGKFRLFNPPEIVIYYL